MRDLSHKVCFLEKELESASRVAQAANDKIVQKEE
jgi:hypothetical protein